MFQPLTLAVVGTIRLYQGSAPCRPASVRGVRICEQYARACLARSARASPHPAEFSRDRKDWPHCAPAGVWFARSADRCRSPRSRPERSRPARIPGPMPPSTRIFVRPRSPCTTRRAPARWNCDATGGCWNAACLDSCQGPCGPQYSVPFYGINALVATQPQTESLPMRLHAGHRENTRST